MPLWYAMLSSEKKLILDQNLSWSTIFYNDKMRVPQRFVLIKNGLPKTICLSQEIISMSNTKVEI